MTDVCEICGQSFTKKSNLTRHVMSVHEHKHYKCPVCNKQFTRRYILNTHMKLHEIEHDPTFYPTVS